MSELLFEYKVRYRYKTGYKEFSFYATTEIEDFLNRNNIEYVRNTTDTVEHRLFKEIERLNNIINELVKFMDEDYEYYKKYGSAEQGHAMGQIRRIKNKLQELKGVDKE